MNWFEKRWEKFKAKSLRSKLSDLVFIFILVAMLTPDGRIMFQRAILATGLFSSIEVNAEVALEQENWTLPLTDLNGTPHHLADFSGGPIFLNFWATWCPPCNAEMPAIIEMMEEYDGDTQFILATNESPEVVAKFLASKGWDIPVYFLQRYPEGALVYTNLPTTLVINAEGEVVHRSEGMRQWSAERLSSLLAPTPEG